MALFHTTKCENDVTVFWVKTGNINSVA